MLGFLDNVAYEALPYGLVGIGVALTYRYLRLIDLTFAASFVAGPSIAGAMLVGGTPFVAAMTAGLALTAILAATTLMLMRLFEIDGLLAGILSSFGGFAIALLFTQGTLSLHQIHTPFDILQNADYPWVYGVQPLHPAQIVFFLFLISSAKFTVDHFLNSELGLAFRAMEDERSRSRVLAAVGISEWRLTAIGVIAGNVFCGLAGLIVMLKEGQVTANRGFDAVIVVITAYLLGHLLFERRHVKASDTNQIAKIIDRVAVFRPTGATLIGLLFYFVLLAAVSRTSLPASATRLVMLAIITLAFAITRWSDTAVIWRRASRDTTHLVPTAESLHAYELNIGYPAYPTPSTVIRNGKLKIAPGSTVQLAGPNGSGKSTLLKYLAGLTPGNGKVFLPARSDTAIRTVTSRRALVGYISQEANLATSAKLTVDENLALFRAGRTAGIWRHWKAVEQDCLPAPVASLARQAGCVLAENLSGGQRQLLNVAELVVHRAPPTVLLFDEPLTHLDEMHASACVDLIEQFASGGRTVLVVQHDLGPVGTLEQTTARGRLARLVTERIEVSSIQNSSSDA